MDRPVVRQERVCDVPEPLAGLAVLESDRLVGAVAARHDERAAQVGHEQVVQRCVREHYAATASPARPRRRRPRRRAAGRGRSAARVRAADRPPRHRAPRGPPARTSLRRTACPRGACASAIARRSPRRLRRMRGGSRRAPSPRGWRRLAGERRPARAASRAAGRTRGTRSARRGTGGCACPRTHFGSPRTSQSRPSSCWRGRTGRAARS